MAEQEYKSKTPVEVAMFLKDNGVSAMCLKVNFARHTRLYLAS